MAHRRVGEPGFADAMVKHLGRRDGAVLEQIAALERLALGFTHSLSF